MFIFLHKYKEISVRCGTSNGNDTRVQSKEWDFQGTSPEKQGKGHLRDGSSLREFWKAKGQDIPTARDSGGHCNIVKEFYLANPKGGNFQSSRRQQESSEMPRTCPDF